MSTLQEDLADILDRALAEPEEGLTFWSFHQKDRPTPLEFEEILERLEDGRGVYVIELVFDENLDLYQRGAGRRVKDARDLVALKRERIDAMSALPPVPRATLPMATASGRKGPLHGALLAHSLDDGDVQPTARPARRKSSASDAAKRARAKKKPAT